MESSRNIYLLEPYTASVLKRAIKTPKIYFRDTGLAAYLTRWLTPETLAVGTMSGAFFETFVVSEISKSYSNSGIDYRYCVSNYRGKDKKISSNGTATEVESEIDPIIEENGVRIPLKLSKVSRLLPSKLRRLPYLTKSKTKIVVRVLSFVCVRNSECFAKTFCRYLSGTCNN